MPGQRARRRKQEEAQRRWTEERAAAEAAAGPWEVLHSTEDSAEHRAFVRQLYEGGVPDDVEVVCDMLCGRLVQPTWYRVRMRRLNGDAQGTQGTQGTHRTQDTHRTQG